MLRNFYAFAKNVQRKEKINKLRCVSHTYYTHYMLMFYGFWEIILAAELFMNPLL